jgi:hypothetical protein
MKSIVWTFEVTASFDSASAGVDLAAKEMVDKALFGPSRNRISVGMRAPPRPIVKMKSTTSKRLRRPEGPADVTAFCKKETRSPP